MSWSLKVEQSNGSSRYNTKPPKQEVIGIDAARAMLQEEPDKYAGISFQGNVSFDAADKL